MVTPLSNPLDTPRVPGLSTVPTHQFDFKSGTVELIYPDGNIPKAHHLCRQNPRQPYKQKMNVCFSNNRAGIDRVLDAVLFCPACGHRVEFRWAEDMPPDELDRQFGLAADCSWGGGSDKGFK